MNIFVTSSCPRKSAEFLDSKRVNKMILESAQMLCSAIHHHCPEAIEWRTEYCKKKEKYVDVPYLDNEKFYKECHVNHPCTKWARKTRLNFLWLLEHLQALDKVKRKRTGKGHKSSELIPVLLKYAKYVPKGFQTPFPNCAANNEKQISYKHIDDVHKAYRLYLNYRWKTDKIPPKWDIAV